MIKSHGPIGTLVPNKSITIVGAGISGLLMGYYLKKENIPFKILEKESTVGGKIGTSSNEFGVAEKSANAVFSNDDVIDLLDDLKISYFQADRKLKKIVWRQGAAYSPPLKKWEILCVLFSLFKKVPKLNNISVKDFFKPLLGEKICSEVLAPALGGVYAYDIEDLHFESIFKNVDTQKNYLSFLLQLKRKNKGQKNKATSISFDGGMQTLIDQLRVRLKDHIEINLEVENLDFDNMIICTNAHEAAAILENRYPMISKELNKITYRDISTATLITKTPISFLRSSFGILFAPKSKDLNSLGILSNSEIYPKRTVSKELNSYTFIVKGTKDIEQKVHSDLNYISQDQVMGGKKSLTITCWTKGIPLYDLNRYKTILQIRSKFVEVPRGLVLFGNYIDGISIREIITMAKQFTQKN
jgi:oxygen-dependent protoporphyrinogen oxidase